MFYWFALAVVALAATAAAMLTWSAWQQRTTTPRNLTLTLTGAACLAMTLAAADVSLPVPRRLCVESLESGDDDARPLGERLRAALDRWTWMLRPCGRLEVKVEPRDLATPIAFGDLVALATRARVAVDVRSANGVSPRPQEIELVRVGSDGKGRLSTTTPIPLSFTDKFTPVLSGAEHGVVCQIADGAAEAGKKLDALLGGRGLGFHRLRCWQEARPEAGVTTYVHVVKAGVVFASSDAAFVRQFGEGAAGEERCDESPATCLGIETELRASAGLDVSTVVGESSLPETASMLVLDRPATAKSCELAKRLLRRGATVVIARPGADFLSGGCDRLIPSKHGAEGVMFDRTPRLTFMFAEEFEAEGAKKPTAVIGCVEPGKSEEVMESTRDRQEALARQICRDAETVLSAAFYKSDCVLGKGPDALVRRLERGSSASELPCGGDKGCEWLLRSSPGFAVARFIEERTEHRKIRENEHLVVFTHDARSDVALAEISLLPLKLHVLQIADPYGISLSRSLGNMAAPQVAPPWPSLVVTPAVPREVLFDKSEDCFEQRVPSMKDIEASDPGKEAWSLGEQTRAAWKRGPEAVTRFPHLRAGKDAEATVAPIRFGWWESPPTGSTQVKDMAVELAATTTEGGLVERPLVVGTMVGRGHLLLMNYSPFEDEPKGTSWRGEDIRTRVDVLGGMDMIEDLYAATEEFMQEVHGGVLEVTAQADGAIWFTVARSASATAEAMLSGMPVELVGEKVVAPLVDFSVERGLFTYALPAIELERLAGCEAVKVLQGEDEGETQESVIHACPPVRLQDEHGRMAAIHALEQLVRYSGGRWRRDGAPEVGDASPVELRTRPFGVGALALIFLVAWSRRAVRRARGWTAHRQLRRTEQIAQRRYDPPEAVVAAGGDWDGRATTWPRTGAFGGYRPIEPGDRAGAIVLGDLLVHKLQGTQVLPRVALRIEEAAPTTEVLINLGASMRAPGDAEFSKARFAGRLGLHVAASAWRIGGEVAMSAVGIAGESEIVPPQRLSPGQEEVEQCLRARLGQRPVRDATPWPSELPECGAVIYVSDFQYEDERALQVWLTMLEGAGIRVGGVMVYSPTEFTMIEGGRLAGSGVWVDRADWDPDDVFAAFCRRRDQIERIFEGTTGGLAVVATTYHQHDIEQALADGRLLQILR